MFIAEYGTTTFQEVLDAYNASKVIFCYDDNNNTYAPITNYTGTDFYFSTGLVNNISASYTLDNNDSWDGGTTTLATVATSGSYNDLSNKPTIPAAQVQANWNETDTNSMAYIQNKPNIPSGVVVDQTYDGTSANAQSGVAMAGELANYTKTANLPLTPYYATSTTAADVATKEVSIPAITSLQTGQIICVKPTITSTVATSKIKLNNFTAYNMRYNGANITTSTDSVVWNENWVSWFVFDGTYWQFAGHGYDNNTNTTYSAMSVSEGTTGTATSARTLSAANLKDIIQGTKLTGLDTNYYTPITASDSILSALGKLQVGVDDANSMYDYKADDFIPDTPLTQYWENIGIDFAEGVGEIDTDGILSSNTNDGWCNGGLPGVNLIYDYWEWSGMFRSAGISSETEIIAVDGTTDSGFLFHIKPNGDVINPDDDNKVLANVYFNEWVKFTVIHQPGETNITTTFDNAQGGTTTTTTALATTASQFINNVAWRLNVSPKIDYLVGTDCYFRKEAGGTKYFFTKRHIGIDNEAFDGQWIPSYQEAIGTTAQTINAQTTKNITFSNLPAKNCEIMFTIAQSTNYDLGIYSDLVGGTTNRALRQGCISMILPVSSNKTIKVQNLGSGTASISTVRMFGYRILGTNTNT